MKNEEIDRIEEVIESMIGSKKARPRRDLFEDIYAKYIIQQDNMVTRFHIRLAIAASVLLLCFNSYLILQTINSDNANYSYSLDQNFGHEYPIGNYNIYSE